MTAFGTTDIHSLAQLLEETIHQSPQRVAEYVQECRQLGIDILPFDINESQTLCVPEGAHAIRIGFSLLVSDEPVWVRHLLAERQHNGPFLSFHDFCERVDPEHLPEETLLRMIKIGGFDTIERSRARLFHGHQRMIQTIRNIQKEQATGQFNLFAPPTKGQSLPLELPTVDEWTKEERIAYEEEAIGFSLEACLLDTEGEEEEDSVQQDDAREAEEESEISETPPETELTEPMPPFPPFEFTEDEYAASFPPDNEPDASFETPSRSSKADLSDAVPQRLIIQLSTLLATQPKLQKLHTILKRYPGNIPVLLELVDLQNQRTHIPARSEYNVDASEACLAALASLTGFHALKFSGN